MTINEAISKYTTGELSTEEVNTVLAEAGAGYSFRPGQNQLTEADLRATTVGHYPDQANGYGLNTVLPDGSTSMLAYVHICGKVFQVFGDTLGFRKER